MTRSLTVFIAGNKDPREGGRGTRTESKAKILAGVHQVLVEGRVRRVLG